MKRKGRNEKTQRRAKGPAPIVDESGKEHAPLPPSASSRWIACPPSMAYVRMLIEAKIIKKRVSGDAAQRGTRIHHMGDSFIRWMMLGKKTSGMKGEPDEIQEARDYAEFCVELIAQANVITDRVQYGTEDKAIVDPLYCWGSRDFWLFAASRLTIVDLKSGREPVVVAGNTQMLIYAMDKVYELNPDEIELIIWQPNSDEGGDPDKSYVYTAEQMSKHGQRINSYIERARQWFGRKSYRDLEDALVAGDHCGWCDALGVCPKARAYAKDISKGAFDAIGEEKKPRSKRA